MLLGKISRKIFREKGRVATIKSNFCLRIRSSNYNSVCGVHSLYKCNACITYSYLLAI